MLGYMAGTRYLLFSIRCWQRMLTFQKQRKIEVGINLLQKRGRKEGTVFIGKMLMFKYTSKKAHY
jgi:hypothetical protein